MELSLIAHLEAEKGTVHDVACHAASGRVKLKLENGFFFVLVTKGTVTLSDAYHPYNVRTSGLAILTPSITATLCSNDPHFKATLFYIVPQYFDSLPDSHPLYSQLSPFLSAYRLPVVGLSNAECDYLQKTFALFANNLSDFRFYRNGMVRQLCSFLLLQTTDLLCRHTQPESLCVSRSKELFREFKRLATTHYRRHHTIPFYADMLHVTPTYLSRVVKQTTGRTVRFHLSELLCADARRLLECTDMDIKEIANLLGFSDQSAFAKFFVKKTSLSPLKYRNERK